MGTHRDDCASELESQLAERSLVVERFGCDLLAGDLPENEFQFHATAIYASGGMILSGDDLTKINGTTIDLRLICVK